MSTNNDKKGWEEEFDQMAEDFGWTTDRKRNIKFFIESEVEASAYERGRVDERKLAEESNNIFFTWFGALKVLKSPFVNKGCVLVNKEEFEKIKDLSTLNDMK